MLPKSAVDEFKQTTEEHFFLLFIFFKMSISEFDRLFR